jgi:hypothetical protein
VNAAKKPTGAKGKKRISKAEFIKRVRALTLQQLSALSPAEQNKRLTAAERRLGISAARPKSSYTERTPAIHLDARNRHE